MGNNNKVGIRGLKDRNTQVERKVPLRNKRLLFALEGPGMERLRIKKEIILKTA